MFRKITMGILITTLVLAAAGAYAQPATGAAAAGQRRGPGPGAGGPDQGRMRPGARSAAEQTNADTLRSPLLAKDDSEKKILDVLDDMNKNQRRGNMNIPEDDGRLLRLLTETAGAKKVVEIGMSNGYSGIWFSLALRKTGGKLITHEIDEGRAKLARENFKRAGVEDIVTIVMGDAHEHVQKIEGPIDILFLDADKPGYPDYLEKLQPKVRPGGLIIAHNMSRPAPDPDFIKLFTSDKNLDVMFLNMDQSGIAIALKKK